MSVPEKLCAFCLYHGICPLVDITSSGLSLLDRVPLRFWQPQPLFQKSYILMLFSKHRLSTSTYICCSSRCRSTPSTNKPVQSGPVYRPHVTGWLPVSLLADGPSSSHRKKVRYACHTYHTLSKVVMAMMGEWGWGCDRRGCRGCVGGCVRDRDGGMMGGGVAMGWRWGLVSGVVGGGGR